AQPNLPLKIRFRAPGDEAWLRQLAQEYSVEHLMEFLPPLPYLAALGEMLRAGGLLVMQAANCNEQIPAKVYEYFRARRPIVALTDPAGDTANLLRASGIDWIAPLDDAPKIASLLESVLPRLSQKNGPLPEEAAVLAASRQSRSETLARLFDLLGKR
ncbi:MAG: glycosyltransferase, partial [Rhodocyclaceae bacterium]|nr:glycosyltransferase [Rhodocyclaceae bacterium]